MKRFFIMIICMGCVGAHAYTLHYGAHTIDLTPQKHTSPALHVQINETDRVYGALFEMPAPDNSVHISYNQGEYWLGPWCMPGTYMQNGTRDCVDCGIGHFCTGGRHRATCTGGAIACPGRNHAANATADASLMNRTLSLDEVDRHVPVTDFSNWEEVGCGSGYETGYHNFEYYGTEVVYNQDLINSPEYGSYDPLDAGTYMFVVRTAGWCGTDDVLEGRAKSASSAAIVVFDHVVSHKRWHSDSVYGIYIDTDGPEFTGWDFRFPDNIFFCTNSNQTNVTNIANSPYYAVCVYRLK